MNATFDQLDLTNATVQEGGPVLKPGVYVGNATEESFEQIGNTGNWKLTVVFTDAGGMGQITHVFNVKHNSADAQRISRDQLKTFLTFGGHVDPDHPGKAPIVGLPAKFVVEKEGTYTDKNGNTRDSNKIKRFLRLDSQVPVGVAHSAAPSNADASRTINDDIPF